MRLFSMMGFFQDYISVSKTMVPPVPRLHSIDYVIQNSDGANVQRALFLANQLSTWKCFKFQPTYK